MKKLFFSLSLLLSFYFSTVSAQNAFYTGWAHYYSDHFHGATTAYGEVYNRNLYTCASLKYPLNTLLRVTRLDNGQSVVVRVNDKGPFTQADANGTEYIVDLSLAAANRIGLTMIGKTLVRIESIGESTTNPDASAQTSGNVSTYGGGLTARGGNTNNTAAPNLNTNPPANFQQIKTINPGQSGYGIQVGSYSSRQNAERQVVSLQKIGVQHLYLMSSVNPDGRLMHKLIIAKFDSKDKAETYLNQVKNQYMLSGFVKKL